ncbi:hypothetical protein CFP56_040716 [Quercus suber]|uniref:Uncharacterized protein n=1 Tax=Quercus suber TaxID=58331 RepID=A0AAW0IX81_QUESU
MWLPKATICSPYPLDQKDMAPALRPIDFGVPIPSKVELKGLLGIIHLRNILLYSSQIWVCSLLLWSVMSSSSYTYSHSRSKVLSNSLIDFFLSR